MPALTSYRPSSRRRILCVFPAYSKAFGTFDHAFPLMGRVKAFMPPQGILLVAALVPRGWEVRFVDENIRRATPAQLAWADAVFVSGMHIQASQIRDIARRAHHAGKVVALGGPSVSASPDLYPEVDYLHCGEVGDATLDLFERLDGSIARPPAQVVLRTSRRLPMTEFPVPAYSQIDIQQYLLASVQFSSGCPFTCEFCDIPGLYGRSPRLKSPEQVIAELDVLADGGTPSIYFVDDNFIANPRAALDLLPHLVEWQRRRDYSVRLSCEATLNLAQFPEILSLMREAGMIHVFCGIETPEPDALRAMKKTQNLRAPILEAIDALNRHGIEVASGIIVGLDTDTDRTADAILEFIEESQVPIVTPNLLVALPGTPLHDRLSKAGRIHSEGGRDSNVQYLRGYETVVEDWKRIIRGAYAPERVYARYATQAARTYPNRARPRHPARQLTWANLRRLASVTARTVWHAGIRADYRREFWRMASAALFRGDIETIFQTAMVAHHLITFGRECATREVQASAYSARRVDLAESCAAAPEPQTLRP